MDIVTDLTARAVSFFSAYRDICKLCKLDPLLKSDIVKSNLIMLKQEDLATKKKVAKETEEQRELRKRNDFIDKLITELIWKGGNTDNKNIVENLGESIIILVVFFESAAPTVIIRHPPPADVELTDLYASPFFWRQCFRVVLYEDPDNRVTVAKALEYIPLLIIHALGGNKKAAYKQRLYQVWGNGVSRLGYKINNKLLSHGTELIDEKHDREKWWRAGYLNSKEKAKYLKDFTEEEKQEVDSSREKQIERLLKDHTELLALLKLKEVSLPFETLFNDELNEVAKTREKREGENGDIKLWPHVARQHSDKNKDPLERAGSMGLAGLALSGGGIRSATFNLGIIQKLAEMDALRRFDYLSTVSGGGYIGSWLVSWIYRSGSFAKVSNRLNPRLSADPMGEEVRPIRWLRMYSNYLSPNTGIMSGDAWTMGMTWIRNTLVNQVILLLLLCTALSAVTLVYHFWHYIESWFNNARGLMVFILSFILLITGAIITGLGMRVFDRDDIPPSRFKLGSSRWLPIVLIIWATFTGFIASSWLGANLNNGGSFEKYLNLTWPVGISACLAMFAIAAIGRYYARSKGGKNKALLWLSVVVTSIIASGVGIYLLIMVCKLLLLITGSTNTKLIPRYLFIAGVPLILETVSICVVCRMALMGSLFPDERREWWGRVGGIVHRLILIWLLITASALVLPDLIMEYYPKINKPGILPAAIATWGAAIGTAVKLAFQSKSVGDKPTESVDYTNMFVKFAPYLFMIGFLLIGSSVFEALNNLLKVDSHNLIDKIRIYLLLTLSLAAITFILSWRVGVNEFSLHHFYRNRLTRAYLGATRRRTARDSTANRFTGFDQNDDIKMKDLMFKENGYMGPYPIVNTALNATTVSALDRQDRKAESFIFSPLFCGFDFSTTRSAADTRNGIFQYGYRYTAQYSEDEGPTLGTAMAVSGAAVSPNMGYHSSAPTAFLLTVFNVRLGRWMGNPRLNSWKRSDPKTGIGYLIKDMIGKSDIENDYVCLSDGGHFDNMGLYELIRRRCTYILLCDAEEDAQATCEGLANAIRRCGIDFGAEIILDTSKITDKNKNTGFGKEHLVKGTIRYPGDNKASGEIIYVKTGLTGNESVDIRQYYMSNKEFPQQSTGDQFFDEAQFESYRQIGYHSIEKIDQLIK